LRGVLGVSLSVKTLDRSPVCDEDKPGQTLFLPSSEADSFPFYFVIDLRQDLFRNLSMAQNMQQDREQQPTRSVTKKPERGFVAFHYRFHQVRGQLYS
jgi:hypothetical protein